VILHHLKPENAFESDQSVSVVTMREIPIRRHDTCLRRFIEEANADARPFRWTKDPDSIIAAVRRGHQALG
jgi:hypothetical protein